MVGHLPRLIGKFCAGFASTTFGSVELRDAGNREITNESRHVVPMETGDGRHSRVPTLSTQSSPMSGEVLYVRCPVCNHAVCAGIIISVEEAFQRFGDNSSFWLTCRRWFRWADAELENSRETQTPRN